MILAIETSGTAGSVALVSSTGPVAETELPATGRRHARMLVPEIKLLLQRQAVQLSSLTGIAVSIGPGSFTGLRVGVVCAKTLAYALRIPIVAIDTFQAVAVRQAGITADEIAIIADALRGEVFVRNYRRNSGSWQSSSSGEIVPLEDWLGKLPALVPVTGPGLSLLQGLQSLSHQLLPSELAHPRATEIGMLGREQLLAGELADPWLLEPHYIRRSAAEEKADNR